MNNSITDLVIQKKNSIPKKKISINEKNLVINKSNNEVEDSSSLQYLTDDSDDEIEV